MSPAELERHLNTLRLHGMITTLDTRIIQANQGAAFVEVFACLVQDELDYRKSRLTQTRFKASGLTEQPTLTEFDWGFNPNLPKNDIYELVTGKFIRDGHDALLIGSPGTGKSHIAKTVANAAILNGYKVVYREAHTFFEDLFEATQLKRRKKLTKILSETDLLVIDDLFLRKKVPESRETRDRRSPRYYPQSLCCQKKHPYNVQSTRRRLGQAAQGQRRLLCYPRPPPPSRPPPQVPGKELPTQRGRCPAIPT